MVAGFAADSPFGISVKNNTWQVEGTRFLYTKHLGIKLEGEALLTYIREEQRAKAHLIKRIDHALAMLREKRARVA
jgi:hypothetical protein